MTTIAYRAGIMAADRAASASGITIHQVTKIARRQTDGTLVGITGCGSLGRAFAAWIIAGEGAERPPLVAANTTEDSAIALVVRPGGEPEIHDAYGFTVAEGPFLAIGLGKELALGAMAHGASAEEAVRIAARFGVGDPTSIDVLRLGSPLAAANIQERLTRPMRATADGGWGS